ncbi:mitochondrial ATP synthase g subunit-domain-containing protein [Syncephalis fuscata]|nr:mitochondrial ATP synthase g subunit-domain-containing protein [Syncephalis fuscata]
MSAEGATAKIAQLANSARAKVTASLNAESARKAIDAASAGARRVADTASNRAQNMPGRIGSFTHRFIYQSKVAAEIAKETARREKLGIPPAAEWEAAKKELLESAKQYQNLRQRLSQLTVRDFGRAAVVATEIYGFFLVGEIIGRRSLVGYKLD